MQVHADPQKLREFCDELDRCSAGWKNGMQALDLYIQRLGDSWRDDQFEQFAGEVRKLKQCLDTFSSDLEDMKINLSGDIENLETYQRVDIET